MGDDELIAFIQNSRERGRIDEQIVQQLLSVGWRKDRVEEAFIKLKEKKMAELRVTQGMQSERPKDEPQPPTQKTTQPSQQPVSRAATTLSEAPGQQPSAQPTAQPQQKAGFSLPPLGLFGKKPQQQASTPPATAQPQSAQASSAQIYSAPPSQPVSQIAQPPFQPGAQMRTGAPAQPAGQSDQATQQPAAKGGLFANKIVVYAMLVLLGFVFAGLIFFLFFGSG